MKVLHLTIIAVLAIGITSSAYAAIEGIDELIAKWSIEFDALSPDEQKETYLETKEKLKRKHMVVDRLENKIDDLKEKITRLESKIDRKDAEINRLKIQNSPEPTIVQAEPVFIHLPQPNFVRPDFEHIPQPNFVRPNFTGEPQPTTAPAECDYKDSDGSITSLDCVDDHENEIYKEWHDNGQMSVFSNYTNGVVNSETQWNENGKVSAYGHTDKNGIYIYTVWYDNGRVFKYYTNNNGIVDRQWDSNGLMSFYSHVDENGNRDIKKLRDGKVFSHSYADNENWILKEWHDNGKLMTLGYHDKHGADVKIRWHANGQMADYTLNGMTP